MKKENLKKKASRLWKAYLNCEAVAYDAYIAKVKADAIASRAYDAACHAVKVSGGK